MRGARERRGSLQHIAESWHSSGRGSGVTRKRPRAFCHGGGGEGWLPRAYRREVRKLLRDLWSLLAFAICDFSHEHHDRGELVGKFVQGVGGGVYLVVIRA